MWHAVADRKRRNPASATSRKPWWFEDWTEGLLPEIRPAAEKYVLESGLKLHDYVAAVHSSMAFAFNLFLPYRAWRAAPLGRLLSGALKREITVERIEFEFCDDADVLGEWRGDHRTAEDRATTSDVAILVKEGDQRGVVLVEVKCGENHFTPCNGITSRGNQRNDVCESSSLFLGEPSACYLTHTRNATKDRRYWDIFAREFGSVRAGFPGTTEGGGCPFAGDNQQPMRNHALALGLVQSGRFDFAHFALVHHDQNPDIPPLWHNYLKLCQPTEVLFSLHASAVVNAASAEGPDFAAWQQYMRERYALP